MCVCLCVCVCVCVIMTSYNAGNEVITAWSPVNYKKMIPVYFIDSYLVSALLVSAPKVKLESIVKLISELNVYIQAHITLFQGLILME